MLLSIDPGLGGTGWAIWRGQVELKLHMAGVITASKRSENFVIRADDIATQLHQMTQRHGGNHLTEYKAICEFPDFQDSGVRSMGWRSGDLQKLTYLVGVLAATLYCDEFIPVKPHRWKGQLPKRVVEARLLKKIGAARCAVLGIKTHACDTVGIGQWWIDDGRKYSAEDF